MKTDPKAKVYLTCPVCGRAFWRWASQARWRGARYCSRSCQNAGVTKRQTSTCQQCGETFERQRNVMIQPARGKFCGRRCYEGWKRANSPQTVTRTCQVCGKSFTHPAAWVKRGSGRTCSRVCAGLARRRGPVLPRRGKAWRDLAASIRERDGHRCVRCGDEEHSNKSLNVDHILPARLFLDCPALADDPRNLASLCTACHAVKTHRYEPRILRGDFLAIEEFYDRPTRLQVMELLP